MKKLIQQILLKFLLIFYDQGSQQVKIPGLLKGKKVLFFIPENKFQLDKINQFLNEYAEAGEVIYLFVEEKCTPSFINNKNFRLISYSYKSVNSLGFPTDNTIRELKSEKYDVIIDLNIEPSYYHRYLMLKLKLNTYIGFLNQDGEKYYNFQIKVTDFRNFDYIYSEVFKFLKLL